MIIVNLKIVFVIRRFPFTLLGRRWFDVNRENVIIIVDFLFNNILVAKLIVTRVGGRLALNAFLLIRLYRNNNFVVYLGCGIILLTLLECNLTS